jgi:hypothetical protein
MPDRAPHLLASAEQVERCRALVAEIDALARQTGGYDAQWRWLNDAATGPVFDPGHLLCAEDISPEFLATIPKRSTIFSGSWLEGTEMNAAGRAIWSLLKRVSPVLGAKIIDRWWHHLTSSNRYRGLPLTIADLLAAERTRQLPTFLRPPASFDGTTYDRMALTERLTALEAAGMIEPLRGKPRPVVLEIGAGYGVLALALKRALPHATYVVVDLPETLKLSGCYLTTRQNAPVLMAPPSTVPPGEPPFLICVATALDRLEGLPIDLAINTLSFGEMSLAEVGRYAAFLRRNLAPSSALFEQNFDNSHVGSGNFCNPTVVLAQHFNHHTPVRGMYIKGRPRVWSRLHSSGTS